MSLTATVTRSYLMIEGAVPSVDDWNTAFEPQVSITGSTGTSDIEDGAVTFSKLNDQAILGATNTVTTLESTDLLLVGDDSANGNAAITVSNFLASIINVGATVATSFDDYAADKIIYYRADNGIAYSLTPAYFAESLINQATEMVDTTAAADGVLITDASAAAGSKAKLVDLESLLPPVATPGTYVNPTSVTLRADGRVTSINSASSAVAIRAAFSTTAEFAVPAAGGVATAPNPITPSIPVILRVVAVCQSDVVADGYVTGDEIDITGIAADYGADEEDGPAYTVTVDENNITVAAAAADNGQTYAKKTGGNGDWAAAQSSFQFKAYVL